MTSADVWFEQAVKLYDESIAEPVFWLGDDCHRENAKLKFKDCYVAEMNTVIHYPWRLENPQYLNSYADFFWSENYMRCKDICIKMMDRLDHYGMFSRLDREIYLKNIAIWILNIISQTKPDALVVAEAPHAHAQYLIYEIFLYLKIPIARFISWSIQPIVQLQRVQERDLVECKTSFDLPEWNQMSLGIQSYIKKISNSKNYHEFIPKAISDQKKNNVWLKTFLGDVTNVTLSFEQHEYKNMFSKDMIKILGRETFRNWKFRINKEYLPVNPQFLGFIYGNWIKRNKRKKLNNEYLKNIDILDINNPYVYFALHYEPERTTNPDGEEFHDQILAIIALRKILPEDVNIYVKEHPSQFYIAKGARGRSPLFYNTIRMIKNVKLIDHSLSSYNLITESLFVATITGTVAIEASILGSKSIYFGNAWFAGMPNTVKWSDKLTFEEIMKLPKANPDDVYNFMIDLKSKYGIPCFRNAYGVNDISSKGKSKDFALTEVKGVVHLMKEFWKLQGNGSYDKHIS